MGEGSDEVLDLKTKVRIKRIANRNFSISVMAGWMVLIWYFFNPAVDSNRWPIIAGIVLIPCSFFFYDDKLSHSRFGRLFHYVLLSSALVPDFLDYWNGDQANFLGNGIWWPLFWYGIAVLYFSVFAFFIVFGTIYDIFSEAEFRH